MSMTEFLVWEFRDVTNKHLRAEERNKTTLLLTFEAAYFCLKWQKGEVYDGGEEKMEGWREEGGEKLVIHVPALFTDYKEKFVFVRKKNASDLQVSMIRWSF